jgi:pimeloyl-ACP methyl ester carboxylesterase
VDDHLVLTRLGPLRVRVSGDGPTALLWHSLFVDSTTWTRVEPQLATQRRLLLVDGPAHGTNPPPARRYKLDDCVGVASDILGHFAVDEPVDWLGNAWGGHVGILFAHSHPSRIRSLMAVGAPIHALGPADRRRTRLLAFLYRVVGPRPLAALVTDVLLGPNARRADPPGAAIVADAFRRANRRAMHTAIASVSLARPDLAPALKVAATPMLITTGRNDPMWTVAQAEAAIRHLPHAALVILPGAGHIGPLLQAPEALIDLATAFWRNPAQTVASHRSQAVAGS